MRVLQVSTWDEQCGSAGYARQLLASLETLPDVICDIYPSRRVHPQQTPPGDEELYDIFEGVLVLANTVDIVHIHHEVAFFAGTHSYARAVRTFGWLLGQLRQRGVPVVVTFHRDPDQASRYHRVLWRWHVARHFQRRPDCRQAIVRTADSRQVLIDSGFSPDQVQVMETMMPRELAARHLDLYAALTFVTCS
jgi:Glycosyltransferase Family 4